jgi:parvulin-like peptidyl-prolyl isomerase
MRKRKSKGIKLVKVEEYEAVKILVDVDDDLYEALAEAGRQHIAKDKVACFTYALNKALLEIIEEVK